MLLAGLLVVLASVPACGALLWTGTLGLVGAARDRRREGVLVPLAALVAAGALGAAPFVARSVAEARHDWVDRDGNGFLDPMAGGSDDWVDVNGATWVRTWVLIALAVMAVAGAVAVLVRRRSGRPSSLLDRLRTGSATPVAPGPG